MLTATDPLNHTTSFTYNNRNQVLTVTNALNYQTLYSYDGAGNLLTVTDPLGHTTTHSYDGNGLRLSTADALNHTTFFSYDINGHLAQVTDPNNNTVCFTYNALGLKTSQADGLGNVIRFTLDNWGRVTAVTSGEATLVTATYDPNHNLLTVTDGNLNTTLNTYDALNRLTSTTNGRGDVVTYTYDAVGKKGLLSSKTDGNNRTTLYNYTARNEVASISYPDSTSESWTYTNNGYLASHTDAKGQTIFYSYDAANRLTLINYPTGVDTSFTYDSANRLTGMTDATGTTSWVYDAADRLISLITPNGTLNYLYDSANRRTQRTLVGVGSWTYGYDDGNRLIATTNPYNETSSYLYNAANLPTQVTHGNGSVVVYSYDTLHRLTDVWHKTSSGMTLGRYQYLYDGAGNVSSRTDNDGSVTAFGYDGANQLISEVRTGPGAYTLGYTYDHNGNRLSKTLNGVQENYTYDAGDHLLAAGSKSYTYDLNGNCTSVTVEGLTTTLSYDYENRVTQITYPGGGTNTFQYNGLGLRTRKVDSAGTFSYVCDGAEVASPVLSDGAAVYTPGLSERRAGVSKFYHADALGSTRGITHIGQSATDSILYDGFGMTVSRTGSTPTPFGFVGAAQYQSDLDSGLMLLGHRYYDASVGRFLTKDPAKDGDNWYVYCNNNPLIEADPEGLTTPIPGVTKPPFPVPGSPDNDWKWIPNPDYDPGNPKSRPGKWVPRLPTKGTGGGQPSASWDPNPSGKGKPHWDLDDGKGGRTRYDEHGKPISDQEAHGKMRDPVPTVTTDPKPVVQGIAWGVVIYWIISEGSRLLFPPRNLVPVP